MRDKPGLECPWLFNFDGFVKSPSAALPFTFVAAAYIISTPHSSGFARLASEAFYAAIAWATFYEIINFEWNGIARLDIIFEIIKQD